MTVCNDCLADFFFAVTNAEIVCHYIHLKGGLSRSDRFFYAEM
ncbi:MULTISPECIES: hypothetical protein [Ruminococcus]|uniref:Transposase n=1 Tax=Ruminococcus bicirculans (ex Wegman et al. 2014) TaxID=1160721 RepID=A0AAW6DWH2_9FIRM|nr:MULTISPECIES: hypothetical protein [Ruminococcus]MEE1552228.1 hypothetical protein [Lachnospiraceae bacterium]MDB8734712.1 hypothetical protein [Ruminococcus bicirculans (ex Wegman et al. 2014)]MDB8741192.1 hypothetical protein [Ruminococcus bicirculans (ex Wegman et al. 2014)]MDB8750141.1 hypothetical protein [Ruminococcus bicirculans (ex Wegman et al. 2014)]MEE0502989.1 hypothetical protein [Ruminococcus sp.]